MKFSRAAMVVALLAGPVYAQEDHVQQYHEESKPKSQTQINAEKAAEKAYSNSLGNIPDAGPVDPWGNARSTAAPKAATKPVAKTAAKAAPAKPKTGSTTN